MNEIPLGHIGRILKSKDLQQVNCYVKIVSDHEQTGGFYIFISDSYEEIKEDKALDYWVEKEEDIPLFIEEAGWKIQWLSSKNAELYIDKIEWSKLEDAYGKATEVPDLLQKVIRDKSTPTDLQSGPWFDLWSRLYHQDSIYSASYVVVPAIVDAIRDTKEQIAMDFFLFPVSIELARKKEGAPSVPTFIEVEYKRAIKELGIIAKKYINNEKDQYLSTAAKAAILVSEGNYEQASQLVDREDADN